MKTTEEILNLIDKGIDSMEEKIAIDKSMPKAWYEGYLSALHALKFYIEESA